MERKKVTFEDIERRLVEIHRNAYYGWIRHVVTLASGSLTVLVALQNNYIPNNPRGLPLLILCWVGLVFSISLGVVALFGEAQTPLDAVQNLRKNRQMHGDDYTVQRIEKNIGTNPQKGFLYAQKALPCFFVASLCCLCVFAIMNLPY